MNFLDFLQFLAKIADRSVAALNICAFHRDPIGSRWSIR